MKPKKDDAGVGRLIPKNQFTEILVISYHNTAFVCPTGEDARVIGLWHRIRDGNDVVTRLLEKGCDGNAGRLVDKESHGKGSGLAGCRSRKNIFSRHDLSGVSDGCTDVF